jgi:alkylation response protein AidB-like acyl-CoA dehydrogenase
MNFELSDDQKLLVETVANFTKKESNVERFRKLRKTELGWDRATWKQMGELGWLGVPFPESVGGAGMSFQEAALILEQLGTTLVPEPYLESVVLAGGAVMAAASPEQQAALLGPMVAGDTSLALAYAEDQSRHDLSDLLTRAEPKGDGFVLRGKKVFVLNGHAADTLIVSARTAGEQRDVKGVSLFAVDPKAPGIGVQRVELMDGRKAANVSFDDVVLPASALLGTLGESLAALELAVDQAAAGACAEGAGLLHAVLHMTRNYLTERKQFGVAIGTFQALQHRAVDMFVETELAKSTAMLAMIKADGGDALERKRAISAAKLTLIQGGGFVVRQGTQLHGGIGVTDEHDVGLYFKRHHSLATLFGDELFHLNRFASLPSFTDRL